MKRKVEKNKNLLNNFILYLTHCDNFETEDGFHKQITSTPRLLYKAVENYIKEDHVDGYGNPQEYCINLWLKAEELNRVGDSEKCIETKGLFQNEFDKLIDIEKDYVKKYLDSVAG